MMIFFVCIGIVWIIVNNIASKVDRFGVGQTTSGNLIYTNSFSKNYAENIHSITSSLQRRAQEYIGDDSLHSSEYSIDELEQMQAAKVLHNISSKAGGKTSRMELRFENKDNVYITALKSQSIIKGEYELTIFILRDKKLITPYERNVNKLVPDMKPCLKEKINLRVEAFDSHFEKSIIAVSGYDPKEGSRIIYYFENWNCLYQEIHALDLEESLERKALSVKKYQIPVDVATSFVNIAVEEDFIAYTVRHKNAMIYYSYPLPNNTWGSNFAFYPIGAANLKFHQNIGMKFIKQVKTQKPILLLLDLISGENDCLFVHIRIGEIFYLSEPHNHFFQYPRERERFHEELGKKEGVHPYLEIKELFKANYTSELLSFTPFQTQNYPNSIVVENSEAGKIVLIHFGKFADVIDIDYDRNSYSHSNLFRLPDQSFVIKAASISNSGLYVAYLCYSESYTRIYLQRLRGDDATTMTIYLEKIEQIEYHEMIIKDIKLTELDDELFLILILEDSEILSYRLGDISVKSGTLYDAIIGDNAGYISFFFFVFTAALIVASRHYLL